MMGPDALALASEWAHAAAEAAILAEAAERGSIRQRRLITRAATYADVSRAWAEVAQVAAETARFLPLGHDEAEQWLTVMGPPS